MADKLWQALKKYKENSEESAKRDRRPTYLREGYEGWDNHEFPLFDTPPYQALTQEDELRFRIRFVSEWDGEPIQKTGYTNGELIRYLQGHREWSVDPCWDNDPELRDLGKCGELKPGEECSACGKVGGIRYGR